MRQQIAVVLKPGALVTGRGLPRPDEITQAPPDRLQQAVTVAVTESVVQVGEVVDPQQAHPEPPAAVTRGEPAQRLAQARPVRQTGDRVVQAGMLQAVVKHGLLRLPGHPHRAVDVLADRHRGVTQRCREPAGHLFEGPQHPAADQLGVAAGQRGQVGGEQPDGHADHLRVGHPQLYQPRPDPPAGLRLERLSGDDENELPEQPFHLLQCLGSPTGHVPGRGDLAQPPLGQRVECGFVSARNRLSHDAMPSHSVEGRALYVTAVKNCGP